MNEELEQRILEDLIERIRIKRHLTKWMNLCLTQTRTFKN